MSSMEPFKLEAGETILWARRQDDGSIVLRVRTADGWETMHDVYPGQSAPEVEAYLDETP